MESQARVKEREKVGREDVMNGEGTTKGIEGEREGIQENGRGIVIDGRGRRKGGGLIHVLDQGAEIGTIVAATNSLEAGTDLGRDATDIDMIYDIFVDSNKVLVRTLYSSYNV